MPDEPGPREAGEEKEPRSEGDAAEKHVDESWKEEARREKERLASGERAAGDARRAQARPAPKPSFQVIVTNLAIQALISLGEIANPITRKQERDLASAKHAIDLLGVLEEKTRGNLTDDEKKLLESTLFDLRTRYLAVGQQGTF